MQESQQVVEIVAIVDRGLGNSAYLVDLGDGQGMVIDPARNPAPYLAEADRKGLRLRWAVETHLHADFVSGVRELAAHGVKTLAPRESRLRFDHWGLSDGDDFDLGELTLRVIGTPGHTPEHCAYLLMDRTEPLALFSGGTLIVGGVARTDLISPELTEELARLAYRSIRDRLLILPDDLAVYPTHGAGSFCSASTTRQRTTTIGQERISNPLLQAVDEEDFAVRLRARLGSYPPYFLRLRELNQIGPTIYGPSPAHIPHLTPEQVAGLMESGGEIVDVRPISGFAAGHIPGSLSIELRDQFASWLGWLVDPERVLVFVLDPDQDIGWAVNQSLNVGYERLGGYLSGIRTWRQSGRPVTEVRLLDADEIPPMSAIVDVRQESEWNTGHVPSAIHIELGQIADRGHLTGEMVLHCGHGQRSMTAASLLRRAGNTDVAVTTASPEELSRTIAATTR